MSEVTPIFFTIFLFGFPILILTLKDNFLKKKGMSQRDINILGVKRMVAPMLVIVPIVFFLMIWKFVPLTKDFLLGAVVGIFVGVILLRDLPNTLKMSEKEVQKQKDKSAPFYVVLMVVYLIYKLNSSYIHSLIGSDPLFEQIFIGFFGTSMLFIYLYWFIISIKKPSRLG